MRRYFYPTLILILCSGGVLGCNLTTTRPIQEMSNAEVALKAAKDLNADSLIPELYRNAVDNFFKAKREYRLKNFDRARTYALRSMRLAEQAEFEAYRLGGATPEASMKAAPLEGSSTDAEAVFRDAANTTPPPTRSKAKPKPKEPVLPQEEPGIPYHEGMSATPPAGEETEKTKPKEKSKEKKPEGDTGPQVPSQKKIPAVSSFPENLTPNVGALPPTQGGAAPILTDPNSQPPDLTPYQGSDLPWLMLEEAEPTSSHIKPLDSGPFPQILDKTFPALGEETLPEQHSFDELKTNTVPDLPELKNEKD